MPEQLSAALQRPDGDTSIPASLPRLQISVRLTPPVPEDDIGESDAANRAEPPHRIPDRQYRVAVPIRRQAESGIGLLLEIQVQRRQGRPQAECTRPARSMFWTAG